MRQIILIPVVLGIIYFLYESGVIAIRSKRSLRFFGSINGSYADFSCCTGEIRRKLRFKENTEYTILFEKTELKGSILISLYDKEGRALLESFEGDAFTFSPEPGKRYKMCIRMKRASGSYRIRIR